MTEGTMLVRVRAAAPNAIDSPLAARTIAQMTPHRYPLVLAAVDAIGAKPGQVVLVVGASEGAEVWARPA